jgi:cyclic pyranopterin phosphate synthase
MVKHVVDYLRLAVTDRCNLRCVYCMPQQGVPFKAHEDILSYEDMVFFVEVAAETGISKVRLTGGEPLVRKGFASLVEQLAEIAGINDISLTTNGILLPRYAARLKAAGLRRVNVSLDTLQATRYAELTRGGSLAAALSGITAAFAAGLGPVKVNAVLLPATMEELDAFAALTRERALHVRFIELMPIGGCGPRNDGDSPTRSQVLAALGRRFELVPTESPGGCGPARYFRIPGHEGTLGFISSLSEHFCESCNRIRLTADGRLRSCLFSDEEVNAWTAIKARDRSATLRAIQDSLAGKTFDRRVFADPTKRTMSQIGG